MSDGVRRTSEEAKRPNVLWIDQDPLFLRELLRLWKTDLAVAQVTSTLEALQTLRDHIPDLIFLELAIPSHLAAVNDEEGFALLSVIRRGLGLDVPVVVVTRHTDIRHRDRALEMGADAYLTKPLRIDELESVIEELLARTASDSPSDDSGKLGDRGSD